MTFMLHVPARVSILVVVIVGEYSMYGKEKTHLHCLHVMLPNINCKQHNDDRGRQEGNISSPSYSIVLPRQTSKT